jgi:hypothetical protein
MAMMKMPKVRFYLAQKQNRPPRDQAWQAVIVKVEG